MKIACCVWAGGKSASSYLSAQKGQQWNLVGPYPTLVLERATRTTEDIDIFWLEGDAFQHMRGVLSECVVTITSRYRLRPDWLNYLSQILLQNEIVIPQGKLWKRFGPLHIYIPLNKLFQK